MTGLVKVTFHLEPDWHGSGSESLWAELVDGGHYRLENTPFYAKGVSYRDVVFARSVEKTLVFDGVALRGGHSTYRAILAVLHTSKAFQRHWAPLESAGCTFEEGFPKLIAIDVPPHASIRAVYGLLERGLAERVWDFEEGHCGHPVPHT